MGFLTSFLQNLGEDLFYFSGYKLGWFDEGIFLAQRAGDLKEYRHIEKSFNRLGLGEAREDLMSRYRSIENIVNADAEEIAQFLDTDKDPLIAAYELQQQLGFTIKGFHQSPELGTPSQGSQIHMAIMRRRAELREESRAFHEAEMARLETLKNGGLAEVGALSPSFDEARKNGEPPHEIKNETSSAPTTPNPIKSVVP